MHQIFLLLCSCCITSYLTRPSPKEARLPSHRKVSQFQEAYLPLEATRPVLVPINKQRNQKYQVYFQPLAEKDQLSPETP
nr:MAG TPA: hypothetical protein [Caudoviricetes sp.]